MSSEVIDELAYATQMLRFSSVSVVYYALLQTFTAILQSIGKSHRPFYALLVGLGIKIVLNLILVEIPELNIIGAIIANISFVGVAVLILAIGIVRDIEIKFSWKGLIYPIIIACSVAVLMYAIHIGLSILINYFVSMVISSIIGCVIYVNSVYFGGVFDAREKREFLIKKVKIMAKKSSKSQYVDQEH